MNLIQIHIAFLIIQLLKRLVFCSLGFSFHVFSQIYHIGRETLRQLIKDDYGWFDSSKRSTSNLRLVENYNTPIKMSKNDDNSKERGEIEKISAAKEL